jgi:hypothetical protein
MRLSALLTIFVVLSVAGAPAATPVGSFDAPITGTLAPGDVEPISPANQRANPQFLRDVYTFQASAGQMVDVTLFASFDCYLLLFGPDGSLVAENDDDTNTNTSRVTSPLMNTGSYQVVVTSFAEATEGTYTLTVNTPTQMPAAVPDTPLAQGDIQSGNLAAGDFATVPPSNSRSTYSYFRDAYIYQGRAGDAVDFTLNCDFDGYLILVDPTGLVIAENDDFGTANSSRISQSLGTAGPHRVIVTTFSGGDTGTYTLSATPGAPPKADTPVALGQAVSSNLILGANAALPGERSGASYARDGFTFQAPVGTAVTVQLNCSFDGYLYLVGPGGQILAENDDNTSTNDAQILATIGQPGPHRVVVTSFFEGGAGTYTLSVAAGGSTTAPVSAVPPPTAQPTAATVPPTY